MYEQLPRVEFQGVVCTLYLQRYENRRLCIRLIDSDDTPYACATVNVPEAELARDEVLVKNWSENRGILAALLKAGVVKDTGRTVTTGHAKANVVRLMDDVLSAIQRDLD